MEHAEKVLHMVFPAGDEATGVVEPGEETFALPPAARPSRRAAILGGRADAAAAVDGDHFNAVACAELGIERVAIVASVPDQSRGELAEEARVFGEALQESIESPGALPLLKPPMARFVWRVATRQVVPRGAGAQDPEHPVEHRARISPRAPAPVRPR